MSWGGIYFSHRDSIISLLNITLLPYIYDYQSFLYATFGLFAASDPEE